MGHPDVCEMVGGKEQATTTAAGVGFAFPPIAMRLRWMGHPDICEMVGGKEQATTTAAGVGFAFPTHRDETAMDGAPGRL